MQVVNNADEIKFRCSSLGHLMTESRSKSETISETTKTHLVDVFVSARYGRREEIHGKMLEKGHAREENSITLLSRVQKIYYKKNSIRLANEFIQGEPDLFLGNSIDEATEITDTKTSWSAHTFFRAQQSELSKMYKWQGTGYLSLTGAKKCTIAYCLVNGTFQTIMDDKRKASYSYGQDFDNDPEYIKECQQIERNHIFDLEEFRKEIPGFDFHSDIDELKKYEIPKEDRVFTISFDRNEDDIKKLYQRVKDCRKWMNENLFKIPLPTLTTA